MDDASTDKDPHSISKLHESKSTKPCDTVSINESVEPMRRSPVTSPTSQLSPKKKPTVFGKVTGLEKKEEKKKYSTKSSLKISWGGDYSEITIRPNSPNPGNFEYDRNEFLVLRHQGTTSTHISSSILKEVRKPLVLSQNDKPAFVTESKPTSRTSPFRGVYASAPKRSTLFFKNPGQPKAIAEQSGKTPHKKIMPEVMGTSKKEKEPVTFLASFEEKDVDSDYDEDCNAKKEKPVELTEKVIESPGSAGFEPATENSVTKSPETKKAPNIVIESSYGRVFLSSTDDEDYNSSMFSSNTAPSKKVDVENETSDKDCNAKKEKPVEFTEKVSESPESAGLEPATDKNSVTKSPETKKAPNIVIELPYERGFLSSTDDENYNSSMFFPNTAPSKKMDVENETSDEAMNPNSAELPTIVLNVSPSDPAPCKKSNKSSKKEKAEDSDGTKKLKRLMKKVKSKKQRDNMLIAYELKKLNGIWKTKEKRKKEEKEANEKRRKTFKRIDRSDVQEPTKIIETPAPQRPLPENLCNDDHDQHGHAFQLLDAMFPGNNGSGRSSRNRTSKPWRDADYSVVQNFLQESRDLRANLLRTFPKPEPDALNRLKQKKTLVSLRNIIWAMHIRSQDPWNQKTVKLMTRRTMFYADEEGVLFLFRKGAFSMIWSDFMNDDRLEVMEQRRPGWMLRPVFVDGHSLLSMFFPESTTFPKIPVKILLYVLMHFLLDGHKVTILLSHFYKNMENVDYVAAFEFLIEQKLVEFIPLDNVDHLETYVFERAEMVNGIIVTTSEEMLVGNSKLCHPVINRFSNRIDDFLFLTTFSGNSGFGENQDSEDVKDSENVKDSKKKEERREDVKNADFLHNEESSEEETLTDENYVKINRKQAFARKCRLYSTQEKEQLRENCNYQLTIKEQVFLISSLCHFTDFYLRSARLIRAFLSFINKYSPDLIPAFMSTSILNDITDALANIHDERNPDVWPLFRKH